MRTTRIWAAFGLACLVLSGVSHVCGSTLYDFDFTLQSGNVAPVSGSFLYDSSALSNPFSNFLIVWDGNTFDFTSNANNPVFDNGATSACFPSLNPAGVLNALTHPGLCFPYPSTEWQGADTGSNVDGSVFLISMEGDGNNGLSWEASDPTLVLLRDGAGTFQAGAVPEPGTLATLLVGAMALAGAIKVRSRRRKSLRC